MLVGIGRVVFLSGVVEHEDVRQRLETVRKVAGHVHRAEVALADVLAEGLARVSIEGDDAGTALKADEGSSWPRSW